MSFAIDLNSQWDQLNDLVSAYISDPLDRMCHLQMLADLKEDQTDGDIIYAGFRRAPAATGNHHAVEGGLVYHLLEMWTIWDENIKAIAESPPYVTDERILKAILYHDLHKAWRTYHIVSESPWQTQYGKDPSDMLLQNDTKSIQILMRSGIKLDVEQMNALLNAEGGYSSIKTKWQSVLAKTAYMLDELSGNVVGRIATRKFLSHREAVPE